MHTLYDLEAQARQREIARAAHHPGRLMAHELRLSRTGTAARGGTPTRRGRRPAPVGRTARVVRRAGGGPRRPHVRPAR